IDATKLPKPRFTVHVRLRDHARRYWIVVEADASVCFTDPGFDVDLTVRADRATLYRVYLGRESLPAARRSGAVELTGAPRSVRAFVDAFGLSPIAPIVAAHS
ncbi:MAG TPA: alkyl sulfatase C-terminal domain-containing protein, partial [Acidimicrobiales bacterium]